MFRKMCPYIPKNIIIKCEYVDDDDSDDGNWRRGDFIAFPFFRISLLISVSPFK